MFKYLGVTQLLLSACLLLSSASVYSAQSSLTDPTRPYTPATKKASKASQFKLHSVLVSNDRRVAVINKTVYAEGDTLPLGKLVAIHADHVVISGKKRHVLRLGRESIRD